MTPRKRLIIFSTLFCISFFIFSSSIILGRHLTFESKVEATTLNKSSYRIHRKKISELQIKSDVFTKRFLKNEVTQPIYLTFDDGPTEYTNDILEILNKFEIKSTFFMLNNNILNKPEVVQAVKENSHTIGCHGVSHQVSKFYKTNLSPLDEMNTCETSVKSITGESVNIIRVPFGSFPHLTTAQKAELDKANYVMWDWNVDSNDWNNHSEKKITQSVLNQVQKLYKSGRVPVILFHDKEVTAKALPTIIESLKNLGYEFLPINEKDIPVQFQIHS
ncbi:polysaccharide deacetylase family protein [Robertmurraya massiliosenegalensis]|uniref:polysaccharide deacetylase family protein n=1 Tax=Robertmurraya TaxID=2837507 RepID=UPI0039A6532D